MSFHETLKNLAQVASDLGVHSSIEVRLPGEAVERLCREWCGRPGRRFGFTFPTNVVVCALDPEPTVPASEHQRVQAEAAGYLDEIASIHAVLLEAGVVSTRPVSPHAHEMVPLADRVRALLEEVEGLRAERDDLLNANRILTEAADDAGRQLADLRAESADLRARMERAEQRRFPIQGGPFIPWAMIAPHEAQAQANHSQSLERLAERGGLSPREACAVLEGLTLHDMMGMSPTIAPARLAAHVAAWEGRSSETVAAEVRRAVEEERASIVSDLRARARRWGADTMVGHALEVAAAAIRARGKE